MNTVTSRPLTLTHVDFAGLYARHLCRHSQFGINVIHLAALFGIWFAVYAFAYEATKSPWVPLGLAAAYLAVLTPNVPLRVLVVTGLILAGFLAAVLTLPTDAPLWMSGALLLLIPLCYKLQAWSHKWFIVEKDMTEFNRRYPKGLVLFVVLLFYEVPLLLNYLVFGRRDGST